jgi:nitrogen fixation-related uncharacterized protein
MEAAPFIAFSLVLMIIVAVAALFLAGKSSQSANYDDPKVAKKRRDDHKLF